MDEHVVEPVIRNIPPYNWLKEAKIYNQTLNRIPNEWIMDGVDAIILYFSMLNVDRRNIINEFYQVYENARYINLPIEVINIPMDENEEDFHKSYEEQANWFTLKHDDPLIPTMKYRYGITAVPHLMVIRTDGTIVSTHGIMDLDEYGMNAVVAWMSTSASSTKPKRLSKELSMYGPEWKYLNTGAGKTQKPGYRRKFTGTAGQPSTSVGLSVKPKKSNAIIGEQ